MMKTSSSSSRYASSRVPSARPPSRPVTVPRRHPHELVQSRVPLALAPAADEPARRNPEPEVVQPSAVRVPSSDHVVPERRFVFPRPPRHPAELLRGTPTDGGGAGGRRDKRAAAPTRVETGSRVEKRPVSPSRATGRRGRSGIRRARRHRRRRRRRRSKVPPRGTVVVAVAASSGRRDRHGAAAAKPAREETADRSEGIVEDVEVVEVDRGRSTARASSPGGSTGTIPSMTRVGRGRRATPAGRAPVGDDSSNLRRGLVRQLCRVKVPEG